MAAMSISSISTTFSNYTSSLRLPCTKIRSKYLSSNRFPRTNFISMSISNHNTNTCVVRKKDGLVRGSESINNTLGEITKAIEESEEDLCLESWFSALKLHEKGNNPRKVIEYWQKTVEILEDYIDKGVVAPVGIVHGWPFAIALVYLVMGSVYHYNLKLYLDSWHYLFLAECSLAYELPQDEHVLQILLETHREQFKLEIMNEDEDNTAAGFMWDILETKEKMMGEDCIEVGEANKDTCIAYLAGLRFGDALPFALKALEIYTKRLGDSSVAAAQLTGILGHIYNELDEDKEKNKDEDEDKAKDDDKALIEQIQLYKNILKNTTQTTCDLLKGTVERSDRLISLERYQEAIEILESVVSHAEIQGGERAIALVSMASAFFHQSKSADARKYMETACQILEGDEMPATYIIVGFWVMSLLYEKMNEYETAISLMRRVLIIPKLPMLLFVEGSEILCSLMSQSGGYKKKEIFGLRDCVVMLKSTLAHKIYEGGYGYVPLVIAYIESGRTASAVKFMEYAKQGNDASVATYFKDSLQPTQSLSVAYATIGSYDLAIALQEKIVEGLGLDGTEPSTTKKLDLAVKLLNQFKEMAGDSQ